MDEQSGEPVPNAETFGREVDRVVQANLARSDAFERRAFGLLTTVTAALTILLAVLGLFHPDDLTVWTKLFGSLTLAALVLSGGFCVWAVRPMDVRLPDPEGLTEAWNKQKQHLDRKVGFISQTVENALCASDEDTPGVLASSHTEADNRGKAVGRAVWALLVALVFLGCTSGTLLWARI